MQAFQTSEEDRKKFIVFWKEMRPISFQLRDACSEFYMSYKKVMAVLERKHDTLKYYLAENKSMDFLKRRLKVISWFQSNKYRKDMRDLRQDWLKLIKNDESEDNEISPDSFKKRNL